MMEKREDRQLVPCESVENASARVAAIFTRAQLLIKGARRVLP